jgi:hypothetical protein
MKRTVDPTSTQAVLHQNSVPDWTLERKVTHHMQDEERLEEELEEEKGGFKMWLEDNLRIILSVLVVFAIAGGIYSYSQRSQTPAITEETETPEETIESGEKVAADTEKTEPTEEVDMAPEEETPEPAKTEREEMKPEEGKKPADTIAESRETESAFIETAVRGDGATHLARRALANYLEKSPDSGLSKEHKIYIEDYLRKHVSYGHVRVGTNLEFSKNLIQEAIGKSKQLNDRQLENLKKYTDRAPSLR